MSANHENNRDPCDIFSNEANSSHHIFRDSKKAIPYMEHSYLKNKRRGKNQQKNPKILILRVMIRKIMKIYLILTSRFHLLLRW